MSFLDGISGIERQSAAASTYGSYGQFQREIGQPGSESVDRGIFAQGEKVDTYVAGIGTQESGQRTGARQYQPAVESFTEPTMTNPLGIDAGTLNRIANINGELTPYNERTLGWG